MTTASSDNDCHTPLATRRARRWSLAIPPILLILIGLPAIVVAASPTPLLHVTGMTLVASREEGASLVLKAERARFDTDEELAYLEDVDAVIPPEEDQGGFEMRCDESEVNLASNDFLASGNVWGRADDEREFETEWVRYDHEKALLYTDAPVVLSESGTRLRGGGFRYLIRERRFTITGGASVDHEKKKEAAEEARP